MQRFIEEQLAAGAVGETDIHHTTGVEPATNEGDR
jgi:hypothetical protein